MPAAEGPQGIPRSCIVLQARHGEEADAADAGCIGKSAVAAGADKICGTSPSGGPKRSLRISLFELAPPDPLMNSRLPA
jgi:hypothetical protein